MADFRKQGAGINYFAVPFLILSILLLWNQWRISRPDTALETARGYLERQFPGSIWEIEKLALVGDRLGKKWRLEFGSLREDGRRIQANILVDRWMPEKIVGKFVIMLGPPQVLDGEWNRPNPLRQISSPLSKNDFALIGALLLMLQTLGLHRVRRRGMFGKTHGVILAVLGGALMLTLAILEVHPGILVAYPLIFSLLGLAAGSPGERESGSEKK